MPFLLSKEYKQPERVPALKDWLGVTEHRERRVLRPVRRRPERRPVPDVRPDPRGGAALLQRTARLLRTEPIRRRRRRPSRSRDVQLCPRRGARDHPVGHGDPVGHPDLRGPADPQHPPQAAVPDLHPAQGRCAGTEDPRVHRRLPRSADRHRAVRLRHRPRRADADEGDRDAARHSRGGPAATSSSMATRRSAPSAAAR